MESKAIPSRVLSQLFDPSNELYPYLSALFDAVPHGVLITNENCEVCFANVHYFTDKLKGNTSPATFVGMTSQQVTDTPLAIEVIKDGKGRYGISKTRADGAPYYCDVVPLFVDDKLIGTFGYGQEYTLERLHQENADLMRKNRKLASQVKSAYRARYTFDSFWGNCKNIVDAKNAAIKMAGTDCDILIVGESGTGKEILAQAIHNASHRAGERFVAINCATLNSELITSELFGYAEGSFTGASKGGKSGLFEVANHGTILLDEISELDGNLQAKLLRVLEERSVRRIGGAEEKKLDIRVIALTNKNLIQMVKQGNFRADLYYRLNVLSIEIPPLRERKEDVDILSENILRSFAEKKGRSLSFSESAKKTLRCYAWPGNVRELRNAVEYAANMCNESVIDTPDLPKWVCLFTDDSDFGETEEVSLDVILARAERHAIQSALDKYGTSANAKKQIAEQLGISLSSLYSKLKSMGIS